MARQNFIRLDDDDSQDLEALVDEHGLSGVVDALAEICHAKADHLAIDWGDEQAAHTWTADAKQLERLSGKLEN
jgi:hypothetical protein